MRWIKGLKKIQRFAGVYAYLGMVGVLVFSVVTLRQSIPDEINIEDDGQKIVFQVPVSVTPVSRQETARDSYADITGDSGVNQELTGSVISPFTITYSCKLFGVFPVKQIEAHLTGGQELLACGVPVGIYTQTAGVLVIGTGEVTDLSGVSSTPAEHIIRSGDYIKAVNGIAIKTKEELVTQVEQSNGDKLTCAVTREGSEIELQLTPVITVQGPKLGLWVRDDLAGIGTITYITNEMKYGALGHSINDSDTGTRLAIADGRLYESSIVGIVKGTTGSPGELSGMIRYVSGNLLGSIEKNTNEGIYGTLDTFPVQMTQDSSYPIGRKQEILLGEATILCALENEVNPYTVEITEINYQKDDENKEIMLKVTDEELLNKTGGIVQGMSGSPIIQNGRIIGAVTHVFVNDPTKGYGIFIEDMLETK